MATLGLSVANDIVNAALIMYMRGPTLSQTTEDKPLLRILSGASKDFPSGNLQISEPVQGTFMADQSGFFQPYTEDDALNLTQGQNILRASYPWKELAATLVITWTELKKDGISVTDDQGTREHSGVDLTRITGLMENRAADFVESWQRAMNFMCWRDGTQDAKTMPGLTAILTDVADSGVTGGLNRATYWWWRHRVSLNLAVSGANQSLTRFLQSDLRQLRRYGGKPNVALCGQDFINQLELEVKDKGQYSVEGFTNEGNTDIGMAKIRLLGLGTFEYDPTLDDLGRSKYCYVFDKSKIQLRPMTDEWNKIHIPARPYNYLIFLKTMTSTVGLTCKQLNCNAVYSVV